MSVRYPWDEWFRKKKFTLRYGEDYQCTTASMAQQVRNRASDRGIQIQMEVGMLDIVVRVVDQ